MREKWKQSKTVTYSMGKERSQKIPLKPIKPDSLEKKKGIIKGLSIKVILQEKQTFLNTKRNF